MNILLPIEISLVAGVVFLFFPRKLEGFTRMASPLIGIINFILSIILFFNYRVPSYLAQFFLIDLLSRFIYLGIGFFGFVISLYGAGYTKKSEIRNPK
ncbi:MAG: hypothetical protein Q7J55_05970, partial [bacterium]|nr:hypothetical protein [bacterium]